MNNLQIFENKEFGQVRTLIKDGQPWFVAKDICTALGLGDTSKAMERLDPDEKGTNSILTPGGTQEMWCVNEYGLYNLVIASRKPEAKSFKRWITHEILPSIRQTGGYITPQAQMLQFLQGMLDEMKRQAAELNEVKEQSSKALETTQNIKDTLINTYDNWRDWVKQNVSAIQKGSNMSYQDVYSRMYEELERRAKCRLSIRVDNQRKRMAMAGASKTAVDNYRSIDAIEDDARLKEIFTAIVKEYAVKYVA